MDSVPRGITFGSHLDHMLVVFQVFFLSAEIFNYFNIWMWKVCRDVLLHSILDGKPFQFFFANCEGRVSWDCYVNSTSLAALLIYQSKYSE